MIFIEKGQNTLGPREINACGDDKVHDFLKENQVIVNETRTKNIRITV